MEQVENRTLDELKFGDTASLAPTLTYKKAQLREKGRGYRIPIEKTRGLSPIRTAVVHPVDAISLVADRGCEGGSHRAGAHRTRKEDSHSCGTSPYRSGGLGPNKTFSPSMKGNVTLV